MKLHWRKIVVNGVEWKWWMGKGAVVARSNGKSIVASLTVITGQSNHDIERAKWKGNLHVTPKQIANWLDKK